jgi:hypothetical protein
MEMEDQLTPTQIKIIAGWSHIFANIGHRGNILFSAFGFVIVRAALFGSS